LNVDRIRILVDSTGKLSVLSDRIPASSLQAKATDLFYFQQAAIE